MSDNASHDRASDRRSVLLGSTMLAAVSAVGFGTPFRTAQAQTAEQSITPSPGWLRALPAAPDTRTKITEEYAKHVARDAYFWAWPLVNMYNRRLAFKDLKDFVQAGPLPSAPLNKFAMLTDYITPEQRHVACPNQDVVYGAGFVALDISPVVIQVPDFGDRFWVYQIVDTRTDSFATLGKMYGTTPGFYMLIGPDWHGQVPKGITQAFRASTSSGFVGPRLFMDDTADDRRAIQSAIRPVMMYPLSEYDGTMKSKDWNAIPKVRDTSGGGETETQWVFPEKFFDELPSDADVEAALVYGKRIKLYSFSQAANPPKTVFVDAKDVVYDSTIPYDLRFFQSLDRVVQSEPWLTRDKAMIDQLKSIGIEKGKPFRPDEATQRILNAAAGEAHAWLDLKYETMFEPYYEGGQWVFPILPEVIGGLQTQFANPDSYPVDGRGVTYTMAFFSTKHSGIGQYYLMTTKDKDGQHFTGANTYRLTVPVNAPVKQYWSATVYDRATHALIREMTRSGRSSQSPDLQKNDDGSVDIYFGPKAPAGRESNWVPTKPGGKFEVLFRFYGPEKSVFDKTWKLPDIERIAAQ